MSKKFDVNNALDIESFCNSLYVIFCKNHVSIAQNSKDGSGVVQALNTAREIISKNCIYPNVPIGIEMAIRRLFDCTSNSDEDEEDEEKPRDSINHPQHYRHGKFECIDAMVECFTRSGTMDFCLCNAFKYLWRCRYKHNQREDVKKAIWYLNKWLEFDTQEDMNR